MSSTSLQKRSSAGAIALRVLRHKFEALLFLPALARGLLQFGADGELIATDTPTVKGLVGTIQALSGAGAVNVTDFTTAVTTTGANALTLANGTPGQLKAVTMVVDGGDGTLTPATKTGFATITFGDVGDSVLLQYHATLGWMIVANYGATVA